MAKTAYLVLATALLVRTDPLASQVGAARARPLDAVINCRAISSAESRLACFDKAAAELADATEKKELVVVDREEVRRTRRSLFGFTLPKLPLLGNDGERGGAEEVRTLETTLKSARPAGYGLWTLVFAEGGTWQTTEISREFDPEAGQSVRVKSGPLGGYMANIDGAKAVRVRRVN